MERFVEAEVDVEELGLLAVVVTRSVGAPLVDDSSVTLSADALEVVDLIPVVADVIVVEVVSVEL